jgi:hypothetical protein
MKWDSDMLLISTRISFKRFVTLDKEMNEILKVNNPKIGVRIVFMDFLCLRR